MQEYFIFQGFSPVLISFFGLEIRYYALAYVFGFLIGSYLFYFLDRKNLKLFTKEKVDNLLIYCIFGVLFGGRIGYVLFYDIGFYLANPADIIKIWHGGMSFHGGMIGLILASYLFSRKNQIRFLYITDLAAVVAPIGLLLGRIANFINGELWGRSTDVSWAVIFPHVDRLPRHPSQLYEAFFEGLVLFVLMIILSLKTKILTKTGIASSIFLSYYAIARFVIEFFREPDHQLGYFLGFSTMGQILCIPMLAVGMFIGVISLRKDGGR